MSIIDNLKEGLVYTVCGFVGDATKVTFERTGEIRRQVKINGLGGGFVLELDDDEEVKRYENLEGEMVRVVGPLSRRRGALAVKAKVDSLTMNGDKGWKEPTQAELLAGARFTGWGMVAQKKLSEFKGNTYRSLQINTFGETYKFSDLGPDLFADLPEKGPLQVFGKLETLAVNTQYGTVNDLILVLEKARAGSLDDKDEKDDKPDGPAKPAGTPGLPPGLKTA